MAGQDDKKRALELMLIGQARRSSGDSPRRRANERLVRAMSDHAAPTDRLSLACECGAPICHEGVTLTVEEYERIRAHPTWILIAAGHEAAETHERIVHAESGYLVVERTDPSD